MRGRHSIILGLFLAAAFSLSSPAWSQNGNRGNDEWQGSTALEGLNTRFKIGGFVQFSAIHDTGAINTPGDFVTSAIATGNSGQSQGDEGRTNFSIQPSRLSIETRTPFEKRRLTTFFSVDLFGDATGNSPNLRLHQAYLEFGNLFFGGDLLIGQAWSTYADLEAFPNTLDFEGPNSFFGTRLPLIRFTRKIGPGLKLMLAAESPKDHVIQGADSRTAWPDGVLNLTWDHAPIFLRGSLIGRDLGAGLNGGPTRTAFGWGGGLSGRIRLPAPLQPDSLTFSVMSGQGIGGVFNDGPPDAAFDRTDGILQAIPTFGWFAGYQHWWTSKCYSAVVYGALEQDNRDFQPQEAFKRTQYASGNLVFTPWEPWLFGIELLYGRRQDKNGADGYDFRTQFTSRFSF